MRFQCYQLLIVRVFIDVSQEAIIATQLGKFCCVTTEQKSPPEELHFLRNITLRYGKTSLHLRSLPAHHIADLDAGSRLSEVFLVNLLHPAVPYPSRHHLSALQGYSAVGEEIRRVGKYHVELKVKAGHCRERISHQEGEVLSRRRIKCLILVYVQLLFHCGCKGSGIT